VRRLSFPILLALMVGGSSHRLIAGGSGLNALVVVDPNSSDSLALGNYYCERRHVPPQNVVRLEGWHGGNTTWTRGQLQGALLGPMLTQIANRGLGGQIDFVVLSMDIPYVVTEIESLNSTTSVLFYGFKSDTGPVTVPLSCSLPPFSFNSYAFSEAIFRDHRPDTGPTYSFLTMMITASNLATAKYTVDQGVASDGTSPSAPIFLVESSGYGSVRHVLFDDATFDAGVQGTVNLIPTSQESTGGLGKLLGYQTGLTRLTIPTDTFVPGAMADTLTSFGGQIFEPNDQTTLLSFLSAGATGSYGTVVEPCALTQKFPSPRNYFFQARGFSLAESYYQSLANPYQGLLVGEPLAAPFARLGSGSWKGLPAGARLAGVTNLTAQFAAADPGRPVQQLDLFIDGILQQTLTNVAPAPGNVLSVRVNNTTVDYVVPTNATLESMAIEMANGLNGMSNSTRISAVASGDRITLRSLDPTIPGSQVSIVTMTSTSANSPLTSFLALSRSRFLDSTVAAMAVFQMVANNVEPDDWIQVEVIKTNGSRLLFSATNSGGFGTTLTLSRSLSDQINAAPGLQWPDGLAATIQNRNDVPDGFLFTLQARAPGLGPSQILTTIQSSITNSWVMPSSSRLETNLNDTQPRNHLYLTAGANNLEVGFPLDTQALDDGYHELTVVAYEGSHVRTQTAVQQTVLIGNTPLTAELTTSTGGTNFSTDQTFAFTVSANTNAISSIELFSTGGSLGQVANQGSATFSVPGTYLGTGLHPFYAIVTASSGARYRTETKWLRLVDGQSPFPLSITGQPPLLSWPALAGRSYDVLSADTLTDSFQLRQTVLPTNGLGQWRESAGKGDSRFYKVRTSP
jgi:uncharacterized protein (TIGR03790 family)